MVLHRDWTEKGKCQLYQLSQEVCIFNYYVTHSAQKYPSPSRVNNYLLCSEGNLYFEKRYSKKESTDGSKAGFL